MIKFTIKLRNRKAIERWYPDKLERLRNWEPILEWIHAVLIRGHLDMHRPKRGRVGNVKGGGNLGPSITNPSHPEHVFVYEKDLIGSPSILFGTDVVYFQAYKKWRKTQKRKSPLQFRAKDRRAVGAIIAEWVQNG